MKPLYLLLAFAISLLFSCSPRILAPQGASNEMQQPYATQEIEGVTVHVESVVMRGDHLLFDIEIENRTGDSLYYTPQHMYFKGFTAKGNLKALTPNSVQSKYHPDLPARYNSFAFHKERAEVFMKKKVSNQKAGKTFLDLLSLGLLANEIVQDSKDANQSFWTEEDQERANNRAAANFLAQMTLSASSSILGDAIVSNSWEREDIGEHYLGSGMLAPEKAVRGLVLFPKNMSARTYKVYVPVGERLFEFTFEKPRPQ